MIQLTEQVWAIQVPDDGWDFGQNQDYPGMLFFHSPRENDNGIDFQMLPPGYWQYLFTTKGATEVDCRNVVDYDTLYINGKSQGIVYCNYHVPNDMCEWYKSELDSLQSLLHSKGCDIDKNWAIILKQNDNGTEKNV